MTKSTSAQNPTSVVAVICLLVLAATACKLSSLTGAKMNMFEGTNAQDGAAKVKAKLGSDSVKVSRMEIHEDRMSIVVQDPR